MTKNRKAAKATKNERTKVKTLPVGKRELTAAEARKVKGGIIAGVTAAAPPAIIGSPPAITVQVGGDAIKKVLASELLVKK